MPETSGLEVVLVGSGWVPLDAYLTGLRSAAAGVVRVSVGGERQVSGTGWLITGSLVVVPAFVLRPALDEVVHCLVPNVDEPVTARVEFLPADQARTSGPAGVQPALLRLVRDIPDTALSLHLASPQLGEQLLMLHYPMGIGQLQVGHGRLLEVGQAHGIAHDAASEPGSAGGALLSAVTLGILGMHWGNDGTRGQAMPLAELLDQLVDAPAWSEIAALNRLGALGPQSRSFSSPEPDISPERAATSAGVPAALLRAALTWTIDPDSLEQSERDMLRPLVADPDADRWSLPSDERRALIEAAGSSEALRSVYRPVPTPGPADRTLQRIITGSALDLGQVPDDELPYCLPVINLLSTVVADLPEPAQVHRELERRRIRSRLRPVATERLWGRGEELSTLGRWYRLHDPPPMLVTGIGGMGKSALIARFVLDLPDTTIVLWLDFDRADLAPDNAVSVLSALVEQVAAQLDGLVAPTLDAAGWPDVARWLGATLGQTPAVLVLDGFEVAQHVERHDELWPVLDAVVAGAEGTRVIVSGRAPVPGLVIGGRSAEQLPLRRLSAPASRRWLVDRGVRSADILEPVLGITDGVPLLLKLALRLIDSGDDVTSLPQSLRRELVEGYLYQRILDRVMDARLRPLAHDALLLRRIDAELIRAVLPDRIPDDLDPEEAVRRLTRELAVVEAVDEPIQAGAGPAASGALRLRPEVRLATLRLLETEDWQATREMDRRVAEWYLRQRDATSDPEDRIDSAAEAVYHFVRAGDIHRAEVAWLPGVSAQLQGTEREVPTRFSPARRWLAGRLRGAAGPMPVHSTTASWEMAAADRIRQALARGLDRTIPGILDERLERSPGSPLLVYDAWQARERGDYGRALALLRAAAERPGATAWDTRVVLARTAALSGDLLLADRALRPQDSSVVPENSDQAAAAVAARIRLGVDIWSEVRALMSVDDLRDSVIPLDPHELARAARSLLAPWDLAVQPVRRLTPDAHIALPPAPTTPATAERFASELDQLRRRLIPTEPHVLVADPEPVQLLSSNEVVDGWSWAQRLTQLSALRWRAACNPEFFSYVDIRRRSMSSRLDQLQLSIFATLGALYPENIRYGDGFSLIDLLQSVVKRSSPSMVDREARPRVEFGRSLLERLAASESTINPDLIGILDELAAGLHLPWGALPGSGWRDGSNTLVLLLLGPDPLDQLERRVLGRPETDAL